MLRLNISTKTKSPAEIKNAELILPDEIDSACLSTLGISDKCIADFSGGKKARIRPNRNRKANAAMKRIQPEKL